MDLSFKKTTVNAPLEIKIPSKHTLKTTQDFLGRYVRARLLLESEHAKCSFIWRQYFDNTFPPGTEIAVSELTGSNETGQPLTHILLAEVRNIEIRGAIPMWFAPKDKRICLEFSVAEDEHSLKVVKPAFKDAYRCPDAAHDNIQDAARCMRERIQIINNLTNYRAIKRRLSEDTYKKFTYCLNACRKTGNLYVQVDPESNLDWNEISSNEQFHCPGCNNRFSISGNTHDFLGATALKCDRCGFTYILEGNEGLKV